MKKYIRVFLLCLLMTLMLVPSTAFADTEKSGTWGDNLNWELDYDGTLTISGTGAMNDFSMDPDGDEAAWKEFRPEIKKVVIEDGVTSIGNRAFDMLFELESVTMPESVTSIGDMSFHFCENLVEINFSNSITSIGRDAFLDCDILTDITLPDGLLSLGYRCFGDTNLESITIPAGVTSIDIGAFCNCSNLKSVTFAGAAPGFGYLPFEGVTATVYYHGCSGTWPEGVKESCGGTLTWEDLGHVEVIDTPEVPVTCTVDGRKAVSHCSVCSMTLSDGETITAKGHTEVIDEAVDPTCVETGLTEGSHCSVCKQVLVEQEVIPAKGHTEVIDESVDPTCVETGLTEGSHCSVCGKVLVAQEVIPATGEHSPEAIVTKATLNADGEIAYKCSTCGTATQDSETIYMPKAFSLSYATTSYNGKAKKPYVTVKDSQGNVLEKDKDYSVAYASGCTKVGIYKVTVKGAGNYSFTKTLTFKINPATPALKKTTVGSKKLTVYMTTKPSSKGASTYQIYYKQKGTSKWKSITTTSASKTIKKLKKGKKYYVKVRAYKTVSKTKYYGAWSKTKLSKKIK